MWNKKYIKVNKDIYNKYVSIVYNVLDVLLKAIIIY